MLDIKFIRANPEFIKKACQNKQVKIDIDQVLELDEKRREIIQKLEALRADHNQGSKEIPRLDKNERKKKIEEMRKLVEKINKWQKELETKEKEFNDLMWQIPNPPLKDVKVGRDEKDNEILRHEGEIPKFDFPPQDYLKLNEKLDLIDTERASKVSGTRFGYLKNEAVLLEFALVQFAFETLIKENFIPIIPPVMIRDEAMRGMGYLEHGGKQETYHLDKDGLYLVGTAEQSIGPMHKDEIFQEKELPKRYVAFSPCFRREAGSYGRDTRGIIRVHQFDKVEMFSFCQVEKSTKEHELFLRLEEQLMSALKIPYRVVKMCTADLGMPAASKYDLESWLPGSSEFRETHSTSNCTDFQARRLKIRYKDKEMNTKFVHTVNGTAFAIGRTIVAILENYQQKDGSIKIPQVLQKYIEGLKIIERK